jgi:arylsulfatase A-like enzyme
MLGDFGMDGKGLPYRCSAGVPLAIRHPDHLEGRRVGAPVELTDITATILDAAGLNVKEAMHIDVPHFLDVIPSRSLMPVVRGEKERVRDFAFCEYANWMMIQTDDRKYVLHTVQNMKEHEPEEELYDLVNDPDEVHNIAKEPETETFRRWCRERILQILTATPPSCLRWAPIRADEGNRGNYPGIAPFFPRKQVVREMKEARESYLLKKWGKMKG